MEIIGRNIPSLQAAIASGFESVASGIQETTQVRGPEAIQNAFETFSPSNLGTLGSPELLPAVADVAQFPEPLQYFQAQVQRNIEGGSGSLQKEFLDVLQDKKFNPNSELAGIAKNEMFDMLSNKAEEKPSTGPYFNVPPPPEQGSFAWYFLKGVSPATLQYYEQQWERREELLKQTPIPAENDALQTGTKSKEAAFTEFKDIPLTSGGQPAMDDQSKHFGRDTRSLPSVPLDTLRPEPAQLTATSFGSSSPVGYVPGIQGSAEQNNVISAVVQKEKPSYNPKKPEYLQGEPNSSRSNTGLTPGGLTPGEAINDYFSRFDKLRATNLQDSADQTETIKNASQPADIIHGSADQTETIEKASAPAVGGNDGVDKDLVDQFPPIPSAKNQLLDITVQGSAEQNESLQDAMKKTTPTDEKIMNPYGPKGIVGLVSSDPIFQSEFKGSADQTDTIKNASEKAKASYTPKEPEYLEGGYAVNKAEGGSASNADQRGIIIVGGKSSDTYFDTIDNTLVKMNQNPQAETIQLFEQQVGALQDMSSTVQKSIQMNQQISSALTDRFRV